MSVKRALNRFGPRLVFTPVAHGGRPPLAGLEVIHTVEVTQQRPGMPVWVDMGVPDLPAATAFYAGMFGWQTEAGPPEWRGYTNCLVRGRRVAGLAPNLDPTARRSWWVVHFASEDCTSTAQLAERAGATLAMPPQDILDQCRKAVVIDPQGAQFDIWQARAHRGVELVGEPGAVAWLELITSDAASARRFYSSVLDPLVEPQQEAGDGRYTLTVGGCPVAGIRHLSGATTSRWRVYFAADDVDAAARRAVRLGGEVLSRPQDSPYGHAALLSDPFGAQFGVLDLAAARIGRAD